MGRLVGIAIDLLRGRTAQGGGTMVTSDWPVTRKVAVAHSFNAQLSTSAFSDPVQESQQQRD